MYLNKVQVYGRLGRDPELKALPNGTSVVNFAMATTRTWKNEGGEKQEQTEWHNIVCFGKRADVISRYVKKGDLFYVEGRMQTRSWEDKETGKKMYRTEVVVDDFQFGNNPKRDDDQSQDQSYPQANQEAPQQQGGIEYPEEDINPDDIPF